VNTATLAALPKVLLHDHLDGGLRPATLVDLAVETGYDGLVSQEFIPTWKDPLAALRYCVRVCDV